MLSLRNISHTSRRVFASPTSLRVRWSGVRTLQTTQIVSQSQSSLPLSPIGVNAAIQASIDETILPRPKIYDEFSLKDRVGIVSGGNRGLGLEMALALCELGARAIYCLDLPLEPSKAWKSTEDFIKRMGTGSRLEYISADVRDQKGIWEKAKMIGDKEGRMDVTIIPLLGARMSKSWSRTFRTYNATMEPPKAQSSSPLSRIGVNAAIQAATDPTVIPRPKIFEEFSLNDRVGIVTGGNRGLGLEMALALCELGASAIYCFDLPMEPSKEWKTTKDFVEKMGTGSRLEYVSNDVRDQKGMWDKVKAVGDREGRMDVCVAAAGVGGAIMDCLVFPAGMHKEVMDINTSGVLFTAQAAGQQMLRFGNSGSIILIASIAGSATLRGDDILPYNASKAAVIQMARSMACELGSKGIRVNTISPGFIRTPLVHIPRMV
ncbi:hypothetical protein C0991_006155 [Blastosporella zonata]|nr:hypothetical protein C0991_006155 [Blastosporella zonata]